jgi:hypothetical protein
VSAIAILVPVLGRPDALRPLVASAAEATAGPWSLRFLCSPNDEPAGWRARELAMEDHRVSVRFVAWAPAGADWAKKINLGFCETSEPFVLLGATDLAFHPSWDVAALNVADETAAGVIGTNDLGNGAVMAGRHSTHPLIRRTYVEEQGTIDEPGKVLHEGYAHQCVDNELVETAMARGQWAFARDSHVEHLHPFWHKAEMDATYEKALSTARADRQLFNRRRHLWRARSYRPTRGRRAAA